ncbi:hypothetical protein QJS83_13040 [Bdellovibrio sp. 22V]|uniref:hypothetical protein n=1 Tax=Bdellovibrio TaxID=958 RepID=UPI0025439219|nr:hypothetical protein [Bdellovibrio sp. 22V]WII71388.1 hypothetical protein QJS83_13040 [Bdellovibrio sp. 22V]
MRIVNFEKNNGVEVASDYMGSLSSSESSPITHKSYHEMSDVPVVEADALAQLHRNLEMLTDLQSRLSFVMREVRYLMKV